MPNYDLLGATPSPRRNEAPGAPRSPSLLSRAWDTVSSAATTSPEFVNRFADSLKQRMGRLQETSPLLHAAASGVASAFDPLTKFEEIKARMAGELTPEKARELRQQMIEGAVETMKPTTLDIVTLPLMAGGKAVGAVGRGGKVAGRLGRAMELADIGITRGVGGAQALTGGKEAISGLVEGDKERALRGATHALMGGAMVGGDIAAERLMGRVLTGKAQQEALEAGLEAASAHGRGTAGPAPREALLRSELDDILGAVEAKEAARDAAGAPAASPEWLEAGIHRWDDPTGATTGTPVYFRSASGAPTPQQMEIARGMAKSPWAADAAESINDSLRKTADAGGLSNVEFGGVFASEGQGPMAIVGRGRWSEKLQVAVDLPRMAAAADELALRLGSDVTLADRERIFKSLIDYNISHELSHFDPQGGILSHANYHQQQAFNAAMQNNLSAKNAIQEALVEVGNEKVQRAYSGSRQVWDQLNPGGKPTVAFPESQLYNTELDVLYKAGVLEDKELEAIMRATRGGTRGITPSQLAGIVDDVSGEVGRRRLGVGLVDAFAEREVGNLKRLIAETPPGASGLRTGGGPEGRFYLRGSLEEIAGDLRRLQGDDAAKRFLASGEGPSALVVKLEKDILNLKGSINADDLMMLPSSQEGITQSIRQGKKWVALGQKNFGPGAPGIQRYEGIDLNGYKSLDGDVYVQRNPQGQVVGVLESGPGIDGKTLIREKVAGGRALGSTESVEDLYAYAGKYGVQPSTILLPGGRVGQISRAIKEKDQAFLSKMAVKEEAPVLGSEIVDQSGRPIHTRGKKAGQPKKLRVEMSDVERRAAEETAQSLERRMRPGTVLNPQGRALKKSRPGRAPETRKVPGKPPIYTPEGEVAAGRGVLRRRQPSKLKGQRPRRDVRPPEPQVPEPLQSPSQFGQHDLGPGSNPFQRSYQSVRDILNKIPGFSRDAQGRNPIVSMIDDFYDFTETKTGERITQWRQALREYRKKGGDMGPRNKVRAVMEGHIPASSVDDVTARAAENGHRVMQQIWDDYMEVVTPMVQAYRREHPNFKGEFDDVLKKLGVPEEVDNYFPHLSVMEGPAWDDLLRKATADEYKKLVKQARRDAKKNRVPFDERSMQDGLYAEAKRNATKTLHSRRMYNRAVHNMNLERTRSGKAPYRTDLDAVEEYTTKAYEYLGTIKYLGENRKNLRSLLDSIQGHEARKIAGNAVEQIFATAPQSGLDRALSQLRYVSAVFKLPIAAVNQIGQFAHIYGHTDLKTTLKALVKTMFTEREATEDFAMISGALHASLTGETGKMVGGKSSRSFLWGIPWTDAKLRVAASEAGRMQLWKELDRSAKAKRLTPFLEDFIRDPQLKRRLESSGFDASALAPEFRDRLEKHVSRNVSNITQFRTDPYHMPSWMNTGMGRTVMQFNSFMYQHARFFGKMVQDAVTLRNPKALVKFMLGAFVVGELVNDLRAVAKGYGVNVTGDAGEEDRDALTRIFSSRRAAIDLKNPQSLLYRLLQNFQIVGGMGLFQSGVERALHSESLGEALGPVPGTVENVLWKGAKPLLTGETRAERARGAQALAGQAIPMYGYEAGRELFPTKPGRLSPEPGMVGRSLDVLEGRGAPGLGFLTGGNVIPEREARRLELQEKRSHRRLRNRIEEDIIDAIQTQDEGALQQALGEARREGFRFDVREMIALYGE